MHFHRTSNVPVVDTSRQPPTPAMLRQQLNYVDRAYLRAGANGASKDDLMHWQIQKHNLQRRLRQRR